MPLTGAFAGQQADGKDLLFRKHVDAAHVSWVDNHLDIQVVDGTQVRPADQVAVRLGPDADTDGVEVSRMRVPSGKEWSFLGKPGTIVWQAPQQMYADWAPVWPGIGAGDIPADVDPNTLSLELVDDGGPGDVEVYRTDYAGYPERAYSSAANAEPELRRNYLQPGAHGHYNWAFTKPGRYDMRWKAHARTKDGKEISSPERTVTWYVGTDAQAGLPEGSYKGTPITTPTEKTGTNTPAPSEPGTSPSDPVPSPETPAPEPEDNPTKNAWNKDPKASMCTHIDAGHLDVRATEGKERMRGFVRWDDPKGGRKDLDSRKFVIEVPDAARTTIPSGTTTADLTAALKTSTAYQLPEIQDQKLPWAGFSTEDLDIPQGAKVSVEVIGVQGPSRDAHYAMGHFDAAKGRFVVDIDSKNYERQAIAMPGKAHTHRAQFFSQPGYYTVYYTITVTKADGSSKYASVEAWYAVGKSAIDNACERTGTSPAPEKPGKPTPEPTPGVPSDPTPPDQGANPGDSTPTDPSVPFPTTPGADGATKPGGTHKPAAKRQILERGHVDLWHVTAKGGKLDLDLAEDITGNRVRRAPETVELHVLDAARTTIPKGWPGAGPAWYLPQSQNPAVLWPGWDTQGIRGGGVDDRVDLVVTKMSGPGQIHLFGTDAFGKMTPLLAGGATELRTGAVRPQTYPAHTHANWVFTKPGIYTVTVQARGGSHGKAVVSPARTYTFTVGGAFRGKAGGGPGAPTGSTGGPSGSIGGASTATDPSGAGIPGAGGSGGLGDGSGTGADGLTPDTASAASGSGGPKPPASTLCSPVAETRKATAAEIDAAKKGRAVDSASATGTVAAAASSSKKVSGSYMLPAQTHVHPNWVFTAPGTYTLAVRQTVTTKDGKKASSLSHLRFHVGPGATGVTDGHFDFGAQLANGTLYGAVKDDRSSPARWVAPSSLTFALGDRAKAKAPAGLEFIAPAGSDVWMVPSTQIAGVPWVGANSMHPSIEEGSTGSIQLTLESASGPGNVGVFTSGNFGSIVGEKWFTATGAPAAAAPTKGAAREGVAPQGAAPIGIAKDRASAAPGQLFQEKGEVMVTVTTGRTADGKTCDLAAAAAPPAPSDGGAGPSDGSGASDGSAASAGTSAAAPIRALLPTSTLSQIVWIVTGVLLGVAGTTVFVQNRRLRQLRAAAAVKTAVDGTAAS